MSRLKDDPKFEKIFWDPRDIRALIALRLMNRRKPPIENITSTDLQTLCDICHEIAYVEGIQYIRELMNKKIIPEHLIPEIAGRIQKYWTTIAIQFIERAEIGAIISRETDYKKQAEIYLTRHCPSLDDLLKHLLSDDKKWLESHLSVKNKEKEKENEWSLTLTPDQLAAIAMQLPEIPNEFLDSINEMESAQEQGITFLHYITFNLNRKVSEFFPLPPGVTDDDFKYLLQYEYNTLQALKESTAKPEKEKEKSEECTICMDQPINTVYTACGHMCVCFECAKKWTQCPICRTKSAYIKVFRA